MPVLKPSRLIEHLALMSFSMFLTNEVTRIVWFGALEALGQNGGPPGIRWTFWAAGVAGAFAAAAVFRYGFHRPVQIWLNRLPHGRRLGAATVVPSTPQAQGSSAVVTAGHPGRAVV